MANEEQLSILNQGVDFWNTWREKNPDTKIDLSGANLEYFDLIEVDLSGAILQHAIFNKAKLRNANFEAALLGGAEFQNTDLYNTNLSQTDLEYADLRQAGLIRSKFFQSELDFTILGDIDLSKSKNLESVIHKGPSTISTDTFARSKGKIPEIFLRGCGLSDWEIEEVKLYNPDLSNQEIDEILYKVHDLRASQAIQISSLFISYSHADATFVDKIGNCLTEKGIRYWRDIHDMKAGKIEKQIDQAISQNRTLLLVLSEHALKSDWIEHEVRAARGLEIEMERDVLCPVALDDSWKDSRWPKRVMEQIMEYNILDFSEWHGRMMSSLRGCSAS